MDLAKQNIFTTKQIMTYIGTSILIGAMLLFSLLWIFGVFGSAKDEKLLQTYQEEKKKNEKLILTSLAEAEKQRKIAQAAMDKNTQLEQKLTERDKKRDEEIRKNDLRRNEENEKLNQEYNADIERSANLSDDERNQDICSRISRLSKDNPSLTEFQCQ